MDRVFRMTSTIFGSRMIHMDDIHFVFFSKYIIFVTYLDIINVYLSA
jgi:hypothetical protein